MADGSKLGKFHFWQTIDKLAKGDLLKYEEVCEIGINMLFLKLEMDAENAAYQERYLINQKNANRKKA
jgi:hypothetical protein